MRCLSTAARLRVLTHLSRGQGMMLRGIDPEADADSHVASGSRFIDRQGGMQALR